MLAITLLQIVQKKILKCAFFILQRVFFLNTFSLVYLTNSNEFYALFASIEYLLRGEGAAIA